MRKLFLVLACMVLVSAFALAQSSDSVDKQNPNNLAADIYIPVPIEPLPEVPTLAAPKSPAPVRLSKSSNGAGKNYSEHLVSCRAHRNFDFKTRMWSFVPALPEWKCTELWGLYLQTKQKIGYQPINSPLASVKK